MGDNIKISKYQNISTKGYVKNWSVEVFLIRKVKNTVKWAYVISDLKSKGVVETFYEKELQKKKKKKKIEESLG